MVKLPNFMTDQTTPRHHRLFLFGSVAYLFGISTIMLRHNVWFSPDQFFIFALVAAVFFGQGKSFLKDWTFIILIFLSYEFFRGALPAILKFPLHSRDLVATETYLFGVVPTLQLQKMFWNPAHPQWYDFVFSLTYMSFFIAPLLFAFFLWMKNKPLFKYLSITVFILFYATFITFVFFPAMPPWMAAEKGIIPPVSRILYTTTAYLTVPGSFPTLYAFFAPNNTAAMPSLHAAVPTILLIFAFLYKNKFIILASLTYALFIYIGIIYLGEHWAIDALAGIVYAIVSFLVTKYFAKKFNLLRDGGPEPNSFRPAGETKDGRVLEQSGRFLNTNESEVNT